MISRSAPGNVHGPVTALYTHEFATDPGSHYRTMRKTHGSMAPVELSPGVPATLVLGYRQALQILHDEEHFPADPRTWQRGIPAECPLRPMTEYRPNAIHTTGNERLRFRHPIADALGSVDLHRLHTVVEDLAAPLINRFCTAGECDVVGQYAFPIVFGALNDILGCPPEIGGRAAAGAAAILDSADNAAEGGQILEAALSDLIQVKRVAPGDDVTSWIMAHEVALDDSEVLHQLVLLYAAGISPAAYWISTSLLMMLTDDRFGGGLVSGALPTRDALDEVLFANPPMANYCLTYPRQPILIDDVWLPAHQPVVISIAACNNDPAVRRGSDLTGNRSHLAFGIGPHACPAQPVSYLIVQDAIDQLLDALPDMELGVSKEELRWRPGPFHRALTALPVIFPPTPIPIGQ